MTDKAIDFIYEIEQECEALSKDIIVRLCKRAIKKMNKREAKSSVRFAALTDDYPLEFSFFDILSIELQSNSCDDINPFLLDFVEDTIDNEYDKLPHTERFILDHSECTERMECDIQAVHCKIYNVFHDMLNQHWTTRKIQNFESKLYKNSI